MKCGFDSWKSCALALSTLALAGAVPGVVGAAESHHVHLTTSNAIEAVKWYARHLGCLPIEDRKNAVDCGALDEKAAEDWLDAIDQAGRAGEFAFASMLFSVRGTVTE